MKHDEDCPMNDPASFGTMGNQCTCDTVPRTRLNAIELELSDAKAKLAEVQRNAWGLIEESVKKEDSLKAQLAYIITCLQELLEAQQNWHTMKNTSCGEPLENARERLYEAQDEARVIIGNAAKLGIS